MTPMTLHFMSTGDIAEYIGVSTTSIKKGYGQLPPPDVAIGSKPTKGWSKQTIDTWIAQRKKQPHANRRGANQSPPGGGTPKR
jgi:predicted DNA-binding transcriptional regulator AlpA